MNRSMMAGLLGVLAALGLGTVPAAAGDWCGCGYAYADYGCSGAVRYYAPPARTFYYGPRYYDYPVYDRRWPREAYYDTPRVYGYGYVSRGPAVLVDRHWGRWRRW